MVFVCFSQDHIAAFPVAVDGNAGHAVQLPQRFRQLLLMGQAVPVEDQAHHDFPCGKSIAGQNMTHQPFARFLIIGRNMILLHKTDHPIQDLPVHRNAQRTVPVGNDLMRPPRVKSGDDMSVFIRPHRKTAPYSGSGKDSPCLRWVPSPAAAVPPGSRRSAAGYFPLFSA